MKVKTILAALAVVAVGAGAAPAVAQSRWPESRVTATVRKGIETKLASSGDHGKVNGIRCSYTRSAYKRVSRSGRCSFQLSNSRYWMGSATFFSYADGSFQWSANVR